MSWYVRYLLLHAEEIKERIINPLGGTFVDPPDDDEELFYSDPDDMSDFMEGSATKSLDEDDFFNDLLIVEKKIKELESAGALSGKDLDLIETMRTDPVLLNLSPKMGESRFSIADRFDLVTNLISMNLGGMFEDDAYIEYLVEKYHLDEEHKNILKQFIKNNVRI